MALSQAESAAAWVALVCFPWRPFGVSALRLHEDWDSASSIMNTLTGRRGDIAKPFLSVSFSLDVVSVRLPMYIINHS
jgi:hypothetical protein